MRSSLFRRIAGFPDNDPEWRLIRQSVRDYAAHRTTTPDTDIDWPRFLDLGKRHRILPLLATQLLGQQGGGPAPERTRLALKAAQNENLARILLIAKETRKLQQYFFDAGIESHVLKGLPLAAHAYHHASDRHAGDIDFLIADRKQLDRTHELLIKNGYRIYIAHAQFAPHLQHLYFLTHKDNVYISPDGTLCLELHWPDARAPAFPEEMVASLFGGAGPEVEHLGLRYRLPEYRPLLRYLIWHGARSHWFRLKWLIDVYLLLLSGDPDAAKAIGEGPDGRSWRLTLRLIDRLFGYRPDGTGKPAPPFFEYVCCRSMMDGDIKITPAHMLVSLTLRPDWNWKAYYARRLAIHINDYQWISLPLWLVYATLPFVRPGGMIYRRWRRAHHHG